MKTTNTTIVDTQAIIAILNNINGGDSSEHREMLIDYLTSSTVATNHKKLRQFLDLIIEEIDQRKAMKGI